MATIGRAGAVVLALAVLGGCSVTMPVPGGTVVVSKRPGAVPMAEADDVVVIEAPAPADVASAPEVVAPPSASEAPPAPGAGAPIQPLDEDGRAHGIWWRFHDDGAPAERREFAHGRPIGRWVAWTNAGQAESVCDIELVEAGAMVRYRLYQSGHLVAVESYLDGRSWEQTLTRPTLSELIAGLGEGAVAHGTWSRYQPEDGTLLSLGNYEQGEKQGMWSTWYPGGAPESRGAYVAGRRDGIWDEWDNGDRRERGGTWDKWTEPGRREHGAYRDDLRHGIWTTWSNDGRRLAQGSYEDGERTGRWFIWNHDGVRIEALTYAREHLHGPAMRWYDDGTPREQGSYRDGERDGEWVFYDQAGQVSERGGYRAGKRWGVWAVREDGALVGVEYRMGERFYRGGYQFQVTWGSVRVDDEPGAAGAYAGEGEGVALGVSTNLVRSYRRLESPLFVGVGGQFTVEAYEEKGKGRVSVGVPLRVGLMNSARRRGHGFSHGTFAFLDTVPMVAIDAAGSFDYGARFALGITSPGLSRFFLRKSSPDPYAPGHDYDGLFYFLLVPLNHIEVGAELAAERGGMIYFSLGSGM
ncbi:toxin-antitoxin system YwqK family antitoxin [Haliangium sp.]|uniref:toxin-antitoxin system YwqK family antitoxin n=1 Tax=Haliangium sp. TaxID=2663208 RepID=UPI003D11E741